MKNRIYVVILFVFLTSAVLFSQSEEQKQTFKNDLIEYLTAFNNGDWEKVMDMIYPKLFDFASKEQVTASFKALEDKGMKMTIDFKNIDKFSEIVTLKNERFCRVYYQSIIHLKLSGELLDSKEAIHQNFNVIYGKENVKYDKKKNQFDIMSNKSMMAITQRNNPIWKYIEYNEQEQSALENLIPEKVRLAIGQ